jgi:hypothetical protein
MIETGEVKKYYQWRSGFRSGQVECYLAETEDTIFFDSGNSVPKNRFDTELFQVDEEIYLQQNASASARLQMEEQWKSLLPEEAIQPIQTVASSLPVSTPTPVHQIEKSPIQIILEKQKKKETRTITISLDIDTPNDKVIDLLTTMFDEDEVYSEIVSSTISKYTEEDLKKLIEESIIKQIVSNKE